MFDKVLNFPCPSCREIISDRMAACRFCGAPVDKGIAQLIGETQRRVNHAFSDAGYVKNAAFLMWGLLAVSLIPFVPWVSQAFLFTFVAVIVLIIRWQIKFGNINSSDPDYQRARSSFHLALILWLAAIPMGFVVVPLIARKIIEAMS
jgi:hypothetical protein